MPANLFPSGIRGKSPAPRPGRRSLGRGLSAAWLGVVALVATASAAPKVAWHIEVKEDEKAQARSTVDLVINDRQVVHLVTSKEVGDYRAVPREEYSAHDVPAKALCACTSWWAGAGTDYYVVAAGKGRLDVYRRDLDEETDVERYKKDRTIRVTAP